MNGAENGGRDYRPGDRFVPAAGGDIALTAADAALAREKLRPAREAGTAGQASAGMTPAREAGAASAGTAPARDAPARDAPAREAAAPAGAGAAAARPTPAGGATADPDATRRLFGLIAIYTLAEGRAAEFDSLAGRIVEKVRASEPDTLVYAVHSVPNAPMQRIVYEVYRDHAAYEEHQRQPHIQCFGRDRAPYVVATNVIELGTQQAKLSPLPGLTQMFGRASGD